MISIIIPAHNEAEHLSGALRSVRVAAERVDVPVETIVVDDASEDRTSETAAAWGARVQRVRLRHIAAVRNAGARVAQGELLVFLDADTQLSMPLLHKAWQAYLRGCIGGGCRVVFDKPLPRLASAGIALWNTLSILHRWAAGSFLFARRDAFERVGGFDERYFAAEEILLSKRLNRLGPFPIFPEAVISSARKLQRHGMREHLSIMLRTVLTLGRSLKRRQGLELWYGPRGDGGHA
jgi:glycosyltransferase involved in cell wall biosynthesis